MGGRVARSNSSNYLRLKGLSFIWNFRDRPVIFTKLWTELGSLQPCPICHRLKLVKTSQITKFLISYVSIFENIDYFHSQQENLNEHLVEKTRSHKAVYAL